jgi:hypothetical protein
MHSGIGDQTVNQDEKAAAEKNAAFSLSHRQNVVRRA